jgi:hypothetical protein
MDIAYNGDNRLYGHVWTSVFTPASYSVTNPAMPLLVMFWIFFVLIILNVFFFKAISNCIPSLKVGDLLIDEGLANYFETLDGHDRNFSIMEEENSRKVMGLQVLSNYTLERLKGTNLGNQHMQGVHCYDILANPLYLDDFQYYGPSREDRATLIIDDDDDEGNDDA